MITEQSAGCVLRDLSSSQARALLIRVRAYGFELPKGHIEEGETPEQAALRELREETGLESEVRMGEEVGRIAYSFPVPDGWIEKEVVFFLATAEPPVSFGPRPERARELRWVTSRELKDIHLVSENLRPIVERAVCRREQRTP